MTLPVSSDHILFDECIAAFRRGGNYRFRFSPGKSVSYIITSFKINNTWDLGICKVEKSVELELSGPYAAFISEVENPSFVGTFNPHLFAIALSSVVSLITLKVCKSPRNNITASQNEQYAQIALTNPTLIAGPGANYTHLPDDKQLLICNEIKDLIVLLNSISYKKYVFVMQCIRLIHLSIINKREDFGLAYMLIVSAIEAVAQEAIKRDEVKEKPTAEKQWEERAKTDPDFADLLKTYKEARGKNSYLGERYLKFILKYAPIEDWEVYLPSPNQENYDLISSLTDSNQFAWLLKKSPFEKYPNELTKQEIEKILLDTYKNRSKFVHRGEQPKNNRPNHENRFFQGFTHVNIEEESVMMNYELLLSIAKHSLLNWFKSISGKL